MEWNKVDELQIQESIRNLFIYELNHRINQFIIRTSR